MRTNKFFFVDRRKKALELLSIPEEKRLTSKEFLSEAEKQYNDLVVHWKRKYNYSSNDPRYLTATYSQVVEDLLEESVYNFNKEIGKNKVAMDILKGRIENPNYDKEMNQNFKNSLKQAIKNARETNDPSS